MLGTMGEGNVRERLSFVLENGSKWAWTVIGHDSLPPCRFPQLRALKPGATPRTLIPVYAEMEKAMPKYFDLDVSLLEIEPRIWAAYSYP